MSFSYIMGFGSCRQGEGTLSNLCELFYTIIYHKMREREMYVYIYIYAHNIYIYICINVIIRNMIYHIYIPYIYHITLYIRYHNTPIRVSFVLGCGRSLFSSSRGMLWPTAASCCTVKP